MLEDQLHGTTCMATEDTAGHHERRRRERGAGGGCLAAVAEPREVAGRDVGDSVAPLMHGDVATVAEDDLVVVRVVRVAADAAGNFLGDRALRVNRGDETR